LHNRKYQIITHQRQQQQQQLAKLMALRLPRAFIVFSHQLPASHFDDGGRERNWMAISS
jgi:hypothetical protein